MGTVRSLLRLGVIAMAWWCIFASLADAQTASITGAVTDPSGASIPGAIATLRNINTGITQTTVSNKAGIFVYPRVPGGVYALRIEKDGFKTVETAEFQLTVSEAKTLD